MLRQPLADRLRPRRLADFVGQGHILRPDGLLRRAVAKKRLFAMVLYGPPGTGKTALGHCLANELGTELIALSATSAGVKELREAATPSLMPRIVFIDELHRLNRTQQDTLLPWLEQGLLVVGATTENPHITLSPAILSRMKVLELKPLTEQDLKEILGRGLAALEKDYGCRITLAPRAAEHLLDTASGDARHLLNALELAAMGATVEEVAGVAEEHTPQGERELRREGADARAGRTMVISLAAVEEAVGRKVIYDRAGDSHYDVISAFIKSMRGSDPDAALHYLARMVVAGEDPRFIARRLMIHAAEDVGLADPRALLVAAAAAAAAERVGWPEARIPLAEAACYIAMAPKSNAIVMGIAAAVEDVEKGGIGTVPAHLRDASYVGAAGLGRGVGYKYPHDFPGHLVAQEYLPDPLVTRRYYRPCAEGEEKMVGARLEEVRKAMGRR